MGTDVLHNGAKNSSSVAHQCPEEFSFTELLMILEVGHDVF